MDSFYDDLAEHYHLLFEDWDRAIERQAAVLAPLLAAHRPGTLDVLDCACGIGTQALGFAGAGHRVTGTDLSPIAIARARHEAVARGLRMHLAVDDMTRLSTVPHASFDVVAALDNALPHLDAASLRTAVGEMARRLRPGGLFLASLRDYVALVRDRPSSQPPAFFEEAGKRRIVHQVWDWTSEAVYTLHLYVTQQAGVDWSVRHFVSSYRCLLRPELDEALCVAGFRTIRWLSPAESGFYQPLVLASKK